MRYSKEQVEETNARLLAAAGRAFRRHGYGGVGIDGLAKEAGVTSGAFYGHFSSKDEAFAAVAVAGLEQLTAAITSLRESHPDDWEVRFVDFYVGDRLRCDLADSCALQSLTADVMRANVSTRKRYEASMGRLVDAVAAGLARIPPNERRPRAIALLSLLSGGVTIARSLASRTQRDSLAESLAASARLLVAR